MNRDAEVVTLGDDGSVDRMKHPRDRRARRPPRPRSRRTGDPAGRPRRNVRLEQPAPLRAYMAIPCFGAVLHTINVRLFAEQIEYIINHAEDRVIFVDDSLVAGARAAGRRARSCRALRRDGRRRHAARCRACCAMRTCSPAPPGRPTSTRSSTSARPRRFATRAGRRATRRACSTPTARSACIRARR